MTEATVQQERIQVRTLEQEMRDSFIDYSMSVIVQRALPDARDGLKPVHRRILFAMKELGLVPGRPHKKSATVVGDVLGKLHPHGDGTVYDTIVRMAQDFSLRYPLVDGQGNFGSIDGDSAAAYRYTEVRLTRVAMELLSDIDKDTVDLQPNFDGRLVEPRVLPARLPHLLLNGADGIAVGMATKVPPHNLGELLAAADRLVNDPELPDEELLALVPGPDFPTGGYIWGRKGIRDAYETGRGRIDMRARIHLEQGRFGKSSLVVTELPYQVNKTRLIEQIARLVRAGRIDAITELRDESDRDGVRLVIELKRDADSTKVVQALFKRTQLRYTFGVIMLALVDGRPQELDLRTALQCFVDHRLEVIGRRAAFELSRSEERAHVVEGLLRALDDINRVVELIRSSRSPESASEKLRSEFELTERQADAILAMRLAQLTGLEQRKLREELQELEASIRRLRVLVADDGARRQALSDDLLQLIATYADPRRTEILEGESEFPIPSGTVSEATLLLLSRSGYVKAQPARGGGLAGAEAMSAREGDYVREAFLCRGSDRLLVITARGHAHEVELSELPAGTRSSRGSRLRDFLELSAGDEIAAVLPVDDYDERRFLLTVTREGQVKRTSLDEYANIRVGGIIAAGVGKRDEIFRAMLTDGTAEIVMATAHGQAIRFREEEIRPMGRSARGVRGMEVAAGDMIVSGLAPRRDSEILVATARGYGKRLPFTEFRLQGRAGKGASLLPDRERVGDLIQLLEVQPHDRVMWETDGGEKIPGAVGDAHTKRRGDASLRLVEIAAGDLALGVHPLRTPTTGSGQETGSRIAEPVSPVKEDRATDPEDQTQLNLIDGR